MGGYGKKFGVQDLLTDVVQKLDYGFDLSSFKTPEV